MAKSKTALVLLLATLSAGPVQAQQQQQQQQQVEPQTNITPPIPADLVERNLESVKLQLLAEYYTTSMLQEAAEQKLEDAEAGGFEIGGNLIKIPYSAMILGSGGTLISAHRAKRTLINWLTLPSPLKRDLQDFYQNRMKQKQINAEISNIFKKADIDGSMSTRTLKILDAKRASLNELRKDLYSRIISNIALQGTYSALTSAVKASVFAFGGTLVYFAYDDVASGDYYVSAEVIGDLRTANQDLLKKMNQIQYQIQQITPTK